MAKIQTSDKEFHEFEDECKGEGKRDNESKIGLRMGVSYC